MTSISFDNPYLLLLAIPFLALVIIPYVIAIRKENKSKSTVATLIMHTLMVALITLALAGVHQTTVKTETEIYFEANTEKGKALLDSLSALTEECDASAVNEQKAKIDAIMNKLPLKDLTTDAFGGGKTAEFFNAPQWDELSATCLGCGTCTFVCPTCQCYDIKDFNTGNGVVRFRCWDSCMYSDFTKMAHGNNRLTQKERFRQRFMHKLVYYPENNDGLFSCVGCGRCLAKCPISMNIVKVMKKIGGNKGE